MARKRKALPVPPPPPDLLAELRRFIKADGRSLGEISRRSGVTMPDLSRFSRGLQGGSEKTINALARTLGLRLVKIDAEPAPGAEPLQAGDADHLPAGGKET